MNESNNKTLVKNTIFLFCRMLVTMGLNLYTTRLILQNLGVSDYGVYGAVGSVVSMFSVLNSGVINANQRFITYELGRKDGNPNEVFTTVLNVTLIFGFILLLILEVVGMWFLQNKLQIPQESQNAAFWIMQFSIATMLANLLSAPYNALVIAHEKMNVFAYVSIFQALVTFASVYLLKFLPESHLFFYGLFLMLISVSICMLYVIYCKLKFKESMYRFVLNWNQVRDIGRFTGWTMIDSGLNALSWQGLVIVINLCFGVTINAVYTISKQVQTSTLGFAQNVQKAISPQITKTYASGEYDRHCALIYNGSKAQIYLVYLIIIPFIIKADYIISLWLGEVPPYAAAFCRLGVLMPILNAGFEVVRNSAYATGKIKKLSTIPNLCFLTILPVSYLVCHNNDNPVLIMVLIVVFDFIIYAVKFYYAAKVSVFSLRKYLFKVAVPSAVVGAISLYLQYLLSEYIPDSIMGLGILLAVNTIMVTILFYVIGLNNEEKLYVNSHIKTIYKRHFNHN